MHTKPGPESAPSRQWPQGAEKRQRRKRRRETAPPNPEESNHTFSSAGSTRPPCRSGSRWAPAPGEESGRRFIHRRNLLPRKQTQQNQGRQHDGENKHDPAMPGAETSYHGPDRSALRRCALHSTGGARTPEIHRSKSTGQKAVTPGRIRRRNPSVPFSATGSIRPTPRHKNGMANRSPAAT